MTPGGRRGRRTGAMVRIARTRISDLFALAEREAASGQLTFANRYVSLARKIGMRYNVRLPTAYRELYCRSCSTFWVEGRTVRTRLRGRRRVRTCLRCGRARRVSLQSPTSRARGEPWGIGVPIPRDEGALAVVLAQEDKDSSDEESEEE